MTNLRNPLPYSATSLTAHLLEDCERDASHEHVQTAKDDGKGPTLTTQIHTYTSIVSPSRLESIIDSTPNFTFRCIRKRHHLLKNMAAVVFSLITLVLLGVIPYLAVVAARAGSVSWTSFLIAGFFVVITVPISLLGISSHLTHWYAPDVQKYVVRILWMVPLYSLTSWSSLLFQPMTGYTDPLRDLYEAFVISSFLYYMIALLGGEETLSETLRRKEPSLGEHVWPLCIFLQRWEMGEKFMLQCKTGTLQFIVVKTITTAVYVILRPLGLYSEGTFNVRSVFTYMSLLLSASMGWAMYCLVKLFVATKEELRSPKDWHPVGKFLCIKGVVFFTWWQGALLIVLRNAGIIGPLGSWNADDVAEGLQDMIVCIEMLGFAIAHHFTFSYRDYFLDGSNLSSDLMLSIHSNHDSVTIDQQTLGSSNCELPLRTSIGQAIWSSTVPNETLNDIARLSRGNDISKKKEGEVPNKKVWGGHIEFKLAESL